jgi:hypothetical protein
MAHFAGASERPGVGDPSQVSPLTPGICPYYAGGVGTGTRRCVVDGPRRPERYRGRHCEREGTQEAAQQRGIGGGKAVVDLSRLYAQEHGKSGSSPQGGRAHGGQSVWYPGDVFLSPPVRRPVEALSIAGTSDQPIAPNGNGVLCREWPVVLIATVRSWRHSTYWKAREWRFSYTAFPYRDWLHSRVGLPSIFSR